MNSRIEIFERRTDFATAMLDRYLPKAPNRNVSDVGAGFHIMEQIVAAYEVVYRPFDQYQKTENTLIWNVEREKAPDGNKAGVVFFLEILEHLSNPEMALNNIAYHIETGGILILTTPNPASSKNRINHFLKGSLYAFQEKHLKEHHVFTPWEHIVRFFLEEQGFEILEYCIIDNAYNYRKTKGYKDFLKKQLEKYLEHRDPKAKGMSYGIVAQKVKS